MKGRGLAQRLAIFAIVLLPLVARQLILLELVLGFAKLGQGLVDPRVLDPGLEQVVQSLSEASPAPGAGQPARRRRRRAARRAGPGRCGSPRRPASAARGRCRTAPRTYPRFMPPEEPRQPLVGHDRRVVGTAERVPVAPAADELQLLTVAVPQLAPDAKLVVGMDEAVGRSVREAKQQVRQGPQRRGLARLVGTVDQVQAVLARGESPASTPVNGPTAL